MKLSVLLPIVFLLTSASAAPALKLERSALPAGRPIPNYKSSTKSTKYFIEPGGDELGHYDVRFFTGTAVSYDERRETLQHLIRSYLTVFRSRNIETWIAHGTLLGWWWNGQILPWDSDLDMQVSTTTLTWLGQNLNMTTHNYTSRDSDGVLVQRDYLLDVNPHHVERVRGDGMNVIDARWIDVRNGLFIDITGLAEVNPEVQPGIWSCKNYHRYRTRDLYPLRETVFEGVPAMVPYEFDRILVEEYSARALTKTLHEGHIWNPEQKQWIKQEAIILHPGKPATKNSAGYGAHPTRLSLNLPTQGSESA